MTHPAYLMQLLDDYANAAIRHAQIQQIEPHLWFASVAGLDGAWADGDTRWDARESLRQVIADWALVKMRYTDGDIPPLDDIDLNRYTAADAEAVLAHVHGET